MFHHNQRRRSLRIAQAQARRGADDELSPRQGGGGQQTEDAGGRDHLMIEDALLAHDDGMFLDAEEEQEDDLDEHHDHLAGRGGRYSVARVPFRVPHHHHHHDDNDQHAHAHAQIPLGSSRAHVQVVELCFHSDFSPPQSPSQVKPPTSISLHFSRRYPYGVAIWPFSPRIPRLQPPNRLVEIGLVDLYREGECHAAEENVDPHHDDGDSQGGEGGEQEEDGDDVVSQFSMESERSERGGGILLLGILVWGIGIYLIAVAICSILSFYLWGNSTRDQLERGKGFSAATTKMTATCINPSTTSKSLSLPYDLLDLIQLWATVPGLLLDSEPLCTDEHGCLVPRYFFQLHQQKSYAKALNLDMINYLAPAPLASLIYRNNHISTLGAIEETVAQFGHRVKRVLRRAEQARPVWQGFLKDVRELQVPFDGDHHQPSSDTSGIPTIASVEMTTTGASNYLRTSRMLYPSTWKYAAAIMTQASGDLNGVLDRMTELVAHEYDDSSLYDMNEEQFIDMCFPFPIDETPKCLSHYCNDEIASATRLPPLTADILMAFLDNTGGERKVEDDDIFLEQSPYGKHEAWFSSKVCLPAAENHDARSLPHPICSLLFPEIRKDDNTMVASFQNWASKWLLSPSGLDLDLDKTIGSQARELGLGFPSPLVTESVNGKPIMAMEPDLVALSRTLATAAVLIDQLLGCVARIPPEWIVADAMYELTAATSDSKEKKKKRNMVDKAFVNDVIQTFSFQASALRRFQQEKLEPQQRAVVKSLAITIDVEQRLRELRLEISRIFNGGGNAEGWWWRRQQQQQQQQQHAGVSEDDGQGVSGRMRKRLPRPGVLKDILGPVGVELRVLESKVVMWKDVLQTADLTDAWFGDLLLWSKQMEEEE